MATDARDPTKQPAPPTSPAKRRSAPKATFRRRQRLKGKTNVDRVYHTGKKRSAFPLLACTLRRQDNGPSRLGISIGKRCGNAVQRNCVKRLLRESYRVQQDQLADGCDFLLVVRPHKTLPLERYRELIGQLLRYPPGT